MADSTAKTCLSRIKTDLAGINGSGGGYNYDFSGTGSAVIAKMPIIYDRVPMAFCWWVGESNEHAPQLGRYKTMIRFGVGAAVAYAADTPESHTLAALNASSDLRKALEADRTLNGNVLDLIVLSMEDLVGDVIEADPGLAIVGGIVEVYHHRTAGAV